MSASSPARLCRQRDSQLIIVDVQERLAAAMPAEARQRVLRSIQTLLQAARLLDVPVTATEQYPKGLGPTESAIRMDLTARARILEKTGFSCCLAEGFDPRLAQAERRQVVIAGMEAHVCVLQTALELAAQGYEVYVVEDGVCSREQRHYANALARLRQEGVIITNVESVLFEWMGDASHPHFKIISGLIK